MHTDFNSRFFNTRIKNCITMLYQQIETPQFFASNLLVDLLVELTRYYTEERRAEYNPEQAKMRAAEVLSEFLQHLVCYLAKSSLAKLHIYRAISHLVKHNLFYYLSNLNKEIAKLIIWQDPKSGNTVLQALCYLDDADNMKNALSLIDRLYGANATASFKTTLTHTYHKQFSLLSLACQSGSAAVVAVLLDIAGHVYETNSSDGFKAFLNHQTEGHLSPLNLAVATNSVKVVILLLAAAANAFGGINTPGFRAYLSYSNHNCFTALNQATYLGNAEMVKLLLATAKHAYPSVDAQYRQFIDQKNKFGLSPFAVACQQGARRVGSINHRNIALLLLQHGADPELNNNKGISARATAPRDWDFLIPPREQQKEPQPTQKRRVIIVRTSAVRERQTAQLPCHHSTKRLRSVAKTCDHAPYPTNKRLRHEAQSALDTKQYRNWH